MTRPYAGLIRNLLIGSAILCGVLIPASAQANDGGRKFMPLAKASSADMRTASLRGNREFISLNDASRRGTQANMKPLNGGASGKVWKLEDLRDAPRIEKEGEVPADIKVAMATARLPHVRGKREDKPTANVDREEIAAAIAPLFAEKKEAPAELARILETDIDMQAAVAEGLTEAVEEAAVDEAVYVWPVAGPHTRISSPYGPRKHPVTGKQDFHAGIDIPAPQGTSVLAAAGGEVTAVGEHPNLGRYVKITHADGSYSLYGHLQRWTTRTGARVEAGEVIGRVGSTGRSTGPHLDFSIRKDGKPFNPMKLLAGVWEEKKLAFAGQPVQ